MTFFMSVSVRADHIFSRISKNILNISKHEKPHGRNSPLTVNGGPQRKIDKTTNDKNNKYFDDLTGMATTIFNSTDIRYIQKSPQSNINDTLKFVPGIRGGKLR